MRSALLDSYLTLSSCSVRAHIPLLTTDIQRSTTNPNFIIDLDRHLNSNRLHPQLSRYNTFISQSCRLKLTLWLRRYHPELTDDDQDGSNPFRPELNWFVDLNRLIYLGKADSETIHFKSTVTPTESSNQLFFKLRDEIYLFEPLEKGWKETGDEDEPSDDKNDGSPLSTLDQNLNGKSQPGLCLDMNSDSLLSFVKMKELIEKQIELDQVISDVKDLEDFYKNSVLRSEEGKRKSSFILMRRLDEIDEKINKINSHQTIASIKLNELLATYEERRTKIESRKEKLRNGKSLLDELTRVRLTKSQEDFKRLHQPRQKRYKEKLDRRRSELVKQLNLIYPIEPINYQPSSTNTNDSDLDKEFLLQFSIGGIYLPNNVGYSTQTNNIPSANSSSMKRSNSNFLMPILYSTNSNANSSGYHFNFNIFTMEEERRISSGLGFIGELIRLLNLFDQRYSFRNLRMIELRETLPNLKNLLLTLELNNGGCGKDDEEEEDTEHQDGRRKCEGGDEGVGA
ncbi:hypothetical protein BY996DRAFT_6411171 [Phakopsora pachyrhizi]|nr:hypothetical protein BY996DRAFT_6411171 [Phakopsora pachyrhizi]